VLTAARLPEGLAAGDAVLLSVRPEAWKRGSGTQGVSGRVVEAEGGGALRVTEPGSGAGVLGAGDPLDLHVDPADVVVLPAVDGEPE
jgi:hypothetical protein